MNYHELSARLNSSGWKQVSDLSRTVDKTEENLQCSFYPVLQAHTPHQEAVNGILKVIPWLEVKGSWGQG